MAGSGPLGIISNLLRTGLGVRRSASSAPSFPQYRAFTGTSASGVTWAMGSPTTVLNDGSVGDNTTSVNGPTGGSSSAVVAMIDLGSAKTVTLWRRRYGTAWGNAYAIPIEASNDGVNWVDASSGAIGPSPEGFGFFEWTSEETGVPITTPYRYWRTVAWDQGGVGAEMRIGDFRVVAP